MFFITFENGDNSQSTTSNSEVYSEFIEISIDEVVLVVVDESEEVFEIYPSEDTDVEDCVERDWTDDVCTVVSILVDDIVGISLDWSIATKCLGFMEFFQRTSCIFL